MQIDTFKERVPKFWNSFIQNQNQITFNGVNKDNVVRCADFFSDLLSSYFPNLGISFEFSSQAPNELFLSPNGNWLLLTLTNYIIDNAPQEIKNDWMLYSTKGGKLNVEDFSLKIVDQTLSAKDFIVYYSVDRESKKIDISVYIEGGDNLPEDLKYEFLFIFLDNSISELFVMYYIGAIEILTNRGNKNGIGLNVFKDKLDEILDKEGWSKNPDPDDIFSSFELEPNEEEDATIREDIFIITTKNGAIDLYKKALGDRSSDDTFLSDCENVGLFYKTLFYSFENLDRDKILDFRDEICDKIELATSSRGVAKWISSATGIDHSYIDFVVYDLDDFVDVVQSILVEYDLQTVGLADFNNPAQVTYFRL